jgi:hypothetical protein
MKGRFEVITSENPKEVKIFWDYAKIPDNIIEIILFKPSELDDEGNHNHEYLATFPFKLEELKLRCQQSRE